MEYVQQVVKQLAFYTYHDNQHVDLPVLNFNYRDDLMQKLFEY